MHARLAKRKPATVYFMMISIPCGVGDIKGSAIHSSGLDRLTDGLSGAVVSVVQQRDQNQDRYWNSKQPKKNVAHFGSLTFNAMARLGIFDNQ